MRLGWLESFYAGSFKRWDTEYIMNKKPQRALVWVYDLGFIYNRERYISSIELAFWIVGGHIDSAYEVQADWII